jgi:NAD+ diphosphatase
MHPIPNPYSMSGLDRADHRRCDPEWLAAHLRHPATCIVPLWRSRSLFDRLPEEGEPHPVFLAVEEATTLLQRGGDLVFLGMKAQRAYVAVDLSALDAPDAEPTLAGRGHFADLRQVGALLPHGEGALLAYARGLLYWHQRHHFCGVCGWPTESSHAGHQRRCTNPDCGSAHFPRTDPAVIMLVHDGGERCVLGRQAAWGPGMHSTLAGFVEPGESLEEAVAREVYEEVGLEVDQVAYQSSQPWPFPASLMLGFRARAAYGRLRVDTQELERAAWFSRAELRASPEDECFRFPRRDSIARRLIEDWLAEG